MYIVLRHFDGRLKEAVVMTLGNNFMRVNIPGEDDTVELTLRGGQWISEDNEAVEMEFMAITAEDEWNRVFDQQVALVEIEQWAAKPLAVGCIPAPAATGTAYN